MTKNLKKLVRRGNIENISEEQFAEVEKLFPVNAEKAVRFFQQKAKRRFRNR